MNVEFVNPSLTASTTCSDSAALCEASVALALPTSTCRRMVSRLTGAQVQDNDESVSDAIAEINRSRLISLRNRELCEEFHVPEIMQLPGEFRYIECR